VLFVRLSVVSSLSTMQGMNNPKLLICICEKPNSNFGPDTNYHEEGFSCFSSVHPGKFQDRTVHQIGHDHFYVLLNSLLT
jgi:hypothetical protein